MIAVGKALCLIEPVIGFLLVKLTHTGSTKGEPDDVEGSLFGLLDPLVVGGSLQACCGPVPSILGLHNVKLGITLKS